MRSWKVLDIRKCMNDMLRQEAFDDFLLAEAAVTTGVSYVIDGHLTKDFFTGEELEDMGLAGERCARYGTLRPICFDMIKGKRTPQSFQFIFLASAGLIRELLEQSRTGLRSQDVSNLSFNVRYVKGELYLTCSATLGIFTPDKSLELAWEQWICDFMRKLEIPLEQLT